jgi:exodeoxyribonuclease-3
VPLCRFNCRAKGIGWRLDNTLVSPSLAPSAHDSFILKDVIGSDHVPLGLTLLVDILKPAA